MMVLEPGQCSTMRLSKRLSSSFVLNVIDDDLTARKALGFHSVDDLVEHLLCATGVTHELRFSRLRLLCLKLRMLSLLAITPAALGNTSSLGEVFVIAQAKEDLAVLFQTHQNMPQASSKETLGLLAR